MAAGSWPRLIVGFLLALEVIHLKLAGTDTSIAALILALIFIILTATYFIFHF